MSIFSSTPSNKLSRSTFNLDHENKLSFDFGGVYPILCHNVLPGDKMSLSLQSFVRTMPLLSPVMHRNDIKIDAFFVPHRLIWPSYEKWLQCTDDTIRVPQVRFSSDLDLLYGDYNTLAGPGSLMDYLGFASIPESIIPRYPGTQYLDLSKRHYNALPWRAYSLIWDNYFRNKVYEYDTAHYFQNNPYDDSDNYIDRVNFYQFIIHPRKWRRDQFTAALPTPQRGNPVLMPTPDLAIGGDGHLNLKVGSTQIKNGDVIKYPSFMSDDSLQVSNEDQEDPSFRGMAYNKGLEVNQLNSPTIEDLRYAEVLEEYEEALARVGAGEKGTIKEWLLGVWNTLSPDARLDRPEYLGGYRGPIQISEVPQTSAATSNSPQGTLAGKGISAGGQVLFRKKKFTEPGILMVTMSVVPKSAYFQGDPREWLYETGFDYPNPFFAHLGEQEVKAQEVCAAQALYNNYQQQTFGYNVRNYEMKQLPDTVHGALRDSLLYWHEARKFDDTHLNKDNTVNLNSSFVNVFKSEVARIFPDSESHDKLIGEFFFKFRAKRNLPYYGIPRIGHNK